MNTTTSSEALAQLIAAVELQVPLSAAGRDQLDHWMHEDTNGAGELHCEVLATVEGQRLWPQLIRRLKKLDLVKIQGDAESFGAAEVFKLEAAMQSGTRYCTPDGG